MMGEIKYVFNDKVYQISYHKAISILMVYHPVMLAAYTKQSRLNDLNILGTQ